MSITGDSTEAPARRGSGDAPLFMLPKGCTIEAKPAAPISPKTIASARLRFAPFCFAPCCFTTVCFATVCFTPWNTPPGGRLFQPKKGNKDARKLVFPVGGYFEKDNYSRSSEGRDRPPRISAMYGMGRHGRGVDYRRRYGELERLRSGFKRCRNGRRV